MAKKLGFQGFDFESSHDIFKEHAQLSAYQNAEIDLRSSTETFRYFNLAGLTNLHLMTTKNLNRRMACAPHL